MTRRDARRGLAAALLALLLLWLVGYPLLVTLAQALEAPRWTLRHFVDFARRPEEWRALWKPPPPDAKPSPKYSFVTPDWARQWPSEEVWRARKRA